MKKNLAGIITLYNPDARFAGNIETYIGYVDKLYIVDNSPVCDHEFFSRLTNTYDNIVCLATGKNLGISTALNLALKEAIADGYDYLLTMDQDSFFSTDQAKRYFDSIKDIDFSCVAVISPIHRKMVTDDGTCKYLEKDIVWTSGNVLNVSVAKKIGMFDEQLFIDSVDHEFCLRARVKGYKVLQATNCYLNHELGEKRLVHGLFKKKRRRFHSPERFYFMIRNSLYVSYHYGGLFKVFCKKNNKELRKEFIRALKYSDKRFAYIYFAMKAWRDYRRGLYGNRVGI